MSFVKKLVISFIFFWCLGCPPSFANMLCDNLVPDPARSPDWGHMISWNTLKPVEIELPYGRKPEEELPTVHDVAICLNRGADPNARSRTGQTPLFWASNPEVLRILLEAGADVNARDKRGLTALSQAAWRTYHPKVLAVFLNAGADVNTRDEMGNTPLLWAATATSNPKIITYLLDAGGDGTAVNVNGDTAYELAKGNKALAGTDAFWALNDARFD